MSGAPRIEPENFAVPCLVCGASSFHEHFGAQTCRACAAFFRRAAAGKSLKCRRNEACPVASSSRSFCRACRFQRCINVGMKLPEESRNAPVTSALPETVSILARLEDAYSRLQNRRKLNHRRDDKPRFLRLDEMEMIQAMDISDVRDMLLIAFDEFSLLSRDQESRLFHYFFPAFSLLDMTYHTIESGQMEVMLLPTGDLLDWRHEEAYMSPQTAHNQCFESRAAHMRSAMTMVEFVREKFAMHLHKLGITKIEMLVLGVLQFWTKGAEGLTVDTEVLIAEVQQRLLSAILEHMKASGVTESAHRLSELLMLGAQLQRVIRRLQFNATIEMITNVHQMNEAVYRMLIDD